VKFSPDALFNSPEHKTRPSHGLGHSDAIETIDDFSGSRDATNRSIDIVNGNNSYYYNSNASIGMGMDGSDWLNRSSSQQPSFISTKSDTFNSSSINATDEFKAILDGGYYEGYWRAKYMRSHR